MNCRIACEKFCSRLYLHKKFRRSTKKPVPSEGMEAEQKCEKKKRYFCTQPKKPGPRPGRMAQMPRAGTATTWADFVVIGDQLWSTIKAIFWCVALSWEKWFLVRIIVNCKRNLRFEFARSYVEHLNISHPNSDFLYQRIIKSWFASIPSSEPPVCVNTQLYQYWHSKYMMNVKRNQKFNVQDILETQIN